MEITAANNNLYKCFNCIVFGEEVTLELDEVKDLIKTELLIKFDALSNNLCELLPRMFIFYIKFWPGWSKSTDYHSGKLSIQVWFERFKQYLILKLNYIVKTGFQEAQKLLNDDKKSDRGTQTNVLGVKENAPFSINIKCQPQVMNTLVYTYSEEFTDSLVLRMHPPINWSNISISQFLNWPYVEIFFKSPELNFFRRNVTEYTRYISLTTSALRHDREEFIDNVDFIQKSGTQKSFTLRYFNMYIRDYVELLTEVSNKSNYIDSKKLNDIKHILNEFLFDIQDININNGSMATNTRVTFNIGKSNYVRVKKFCTKGSKKKTNEIGYCEFITPKIELGLVDFKGTQDKTKEGVHFIYLDQLLNSSNDVLKSIVPKLQFRCGFCCLDFDSVLTIYHHFTQFHKFEQSVVCFKCKASFPLPFITNSRWSHSCKAVGTQEPGKQQ